MTGFALFITHRTLPGKRDEVRHVWEAHMAPEIAKNAGHLAYFYCFANDDSDLIRVFQQYADRAASQAFIENPPYKKYLHAVSHLLAGPPEINDATPIWTKTR
jgi:quinol monooxygenase YgiN